MCAAINNGNHGNGTDPCSVCALQRVLKYPLLVREVISSTNEDMSEAQEAGLC